MTAADTLCQGLLRFAPQITVTTTERPQAVFEAALQKDPRLLYYLDGYSVRGVVGRYTYTVRYRDTAFPIANVLHVTGAAVEPYLKQKITAYQTQLAFVAAPTVNVAWTLECFMQKQASFFPNFLGFRRTESQLPGFPWKVHSIRLDYRIDAARLQQMERAVEAEVQRLARVLFAPGMPEAARCLMAHNYLAATVKYTLNPAADPAELSVQQSAYGALIAKRCVCQGYAEAFKRLMDAARVRCEVITGTITKDGEGHAWNLVHFSGGQHCHVDVTWDSQSFGVLDKYFLCSDVRMKANRSWEYFYFTPCTDGTAIRRAAQNYLRENRAALLARGVRPSWLTNTAL